VFYNVRRYDLLEMEEMSRLFTVTETCKYLRISPPTLYRMIEPV
jgi:predicted DNA-binding transcriptional regulator AlpA